MTNNEFELRNLKRKELIEKEIKPYKSSFKISTTLKECNNMNINENVTIAGRIIFKRKFGKLYFIKLQDFDGSMQISISLKEVGPDAFDFLNNYIDLGDFIGVNGILYRTKTDELTVRVFSFEILTKTLASLPEKWNGVENIDIKYRQRYLDLISSANTRRTFQFRSDVIKEIRSFLNKNDFIEVETPILQSVASGASAKPFVTKHNTLDKDLYLRIAPELYLKQLVAGGINKVFEIGKNFRNEGMDSSHLQEFTMIEWYAAYWDFEDNIVFVRKMIKHLLQELCQTQKIEYENHILDFSSEWKRVDYCEEINNLIKGNINSYRNLADLKLVIKKFDLLSDEDIHKSNSIPSLIDLLYKKRIRPYIIQPTILYNYPASLVPLARPNDNDENLIDMFQIVVAGWEIVKSYSELVDPIVQDIKLKDQIVNKQNGDDETVEYDNSFIKAMEHGMPPMSGLGMGLDRFIAILMNKSNLRDVVFFPQMR